MGYRLAPRSVRSPRWKKAPPWDYSPVIYVRQVWWRMAAGITLGPFFGGGSLGFILGTADGVAEGATGGSVASAIRAASGVADGTTMGPLSGTGILGVNLKVVGNQLGIDDLVAMGTNLGVLAGDIRTAGVVADGTTLGPFAGGGSVGFILGTAEGVAEGATRGSVASVVGAASGEANGTTMGPLSGTGSLGVNLEVVGNQLSTDDLVEMGTTLGVLAGAFITGRSGLEVARDQTIALGFKVFTLTGRGEISLDSKMVGVISNDDSSKMVSSGGTSVAATSNGGKVGVATSGGSTAASSGAEWATSIGDFSDGRFRRSIRGGVTMNVLVHLPRGIFLNKPISNLPGAGLWVSTGVSTDSEICVVVGRLPPRHAYAIAQHAWNSVASAMFMAA
jgi:hypothetical protein